MREEMYYVNWVDPEDWDDSTNRGFEEFEDEEELLSWAQEHSKYIFKVFRGIEVKLRPVEIVTKFEIDEDWEDVLEN
jgi:hypothetical protein